MHVTDKGEIWSFVYEYLCFSIITSAQIHGSELSKEVVHIVPHIKIALCYSSMWAKIALRYELDEWYHQNLFIHSSGKYTVQNHDTTGSVSAEGHFLKL